MYSYILSIEFAISLSSFINQISSSVASKTAGRASTKSTAPIVIPQQRLARIAFALEWDQDNADQLEDINGHRLLSSQKKTLSRTGLVENVQSEEDLHLPESVSTLSGEISDLEEEEEIHEEKEHDISTERQPNPTKEDEAEMREIYQSLFRVEEELLDQHMSTLQVSFETTICANILITKKC